MTEVNPNNGNETKSDIFPWDTFKSGAISFLSKNIKIFQWFLKSKFLSFIAEMNTNNENGTKSDMFPWDIFKTDAISIFYQTWCYIFFYQTWYYIFFCQKVLKCFHDFQNQNVSVLWLKSTQTMEIKQNQTFFHGTMAMIGHIQIWYHFS